MVNGPVFEHRSKSGKFVTYQNGVKTQIIMEASLCFHLKTGLFSLDLNKQVHNPVLRRLKIQHEYNFILATISNLPFKIQTKMSGLGMVPIIQNLIFKKSKFQLILVFEGSEPHCTVRIHIPDTRKIFDLVEGSIL